MITISWIIERLLVRPTEGTYTDVVITADWRCNGTDGTYSGTCYGSASFAVPSNPFTPYPDLTQDQVLGWCYSNGVDKTAIEANVSLQIQNQINPPVVVLPLPWVPPAPEPQPEPVTEAPAAPVVVADEAPVADAPAA
jgi:hypothetical protein